VLETFQSVVAQLQELRKALEQLSAEARERANSARNSASGLSRVCRRA
jgi:hypothetical protein